MIETSPTGRAVGTNQRGSVVELEPKRSVHTSIGVLRLPMLLSHTSTIGLVEQSIRIKFGVTSTSVRSTTVPATVVSGRSRLSYTTPATTPTLSAAIVSGVNHREE